jgi:predicted nucleic acid-binding protein
MNAGSLVVSTQVLQELYSVGVNKLGQQPLRMKAVLQGIAQYELVQVDFDIIQHAIDLSVLNSISFWDSLLLAAAVAANCGELLTEDLQHGQTIAGVRIVDPFL